MMSEGMTAAQYMWHVVLPQAGEHATRRHPRKLMLIYGMTARMYFACCYPVLRIARWAETKFGSVRLPS